VAVCLAFVGNMSVCAQKKNLNQFPTVALVNDSNAVDFGFLMKLRRDAVSAVSVVKPGDRLTFDDAESAVSQMDMLLGLSSGNNIRNIGAALYVIDGIPGRDINLLNASEIERITVLKDVNALALYGSQAKNGVIVITTKRGASNKNEIKFKVNHGIKSPISYPDYLGSAEYMELYNEARVNDGLAKTYDSTTIANTRLGLNPYRYQDVNFYDDQYLKPFTTQTAVTAEFSGGNKDLRYYVNLSYKNVGTLEKINPELNKGADNFKVRGNLDFPVNNWIKSTVDIMASIISQKTAPASVLSSATSFRPNLYAPFLPTSMVKDSLQSQLNTMNVFDGSILGGSASYKSNIPFAQIYAQGYNTLMNRTTQVANTLEFDLSKITNGLSAKTYVSLDYYDYYNTSIANKFNFYEPTWRNDSIIKLTPLGEVDLKDTKENVSTLGFTMRTGFFGQLNYAKIFHKDHAVNAMLVGASNSAKYSGVKQTYVYSHAAFNLDYSYKGKYYANFTSTYTYSTKLADGHRGKLAPTAGLAYVISEEDFMRDIKAIDYLKLRTTWGRLNTDVDISNYYMYQDVYEIESAGSYSWADGAKSTKRTVLNNGRNLGLTYAAREDLTAGFEASLFRALSLEFNFFRTDMSGFVSQNNTIYPSFYTPFMPYSNSERNRYEGFELGLNLKKNVGKLHVNVGGTFLYSKSKVMEADELQQEYAYQSSIGQSLGRISGLESLGLYTKDDFNPNGTLVAGLPIPQFGAVKPGDIKYADTNNDHFIDTKDNHTIGNNAFPYSFGVNLLLRYEGFSLFVLGKGQTGAETTKSGDYYWVNGDDKYSTVVRNRWTEATAATATYPRLTTGTGSNNFRASTYWLYDKSYFDIRRVQLTYEFTKKVCKYLGITDLSVNLAGADLWTFAPNNDILDLNVGGNPQFRNVTLGLKFSL
ncbi:MAG: SusC/RagA family TonB-linked outer membrane protein, partial [Bacteroidia bacterium]|nr:SusC/RagA family TonB-linked outer membrane protein [Bacteroidia bacterium]